MSCGSIMRLNSNRLTAQKVRSWSEDYLGKTNWNPCGKEKIGVISDLDEKRWIWRVNVTRHALYKIHTKTLPPTFCTVRDQNSSSQADLYSCSEMCITCVGKLKQVLSACYIGFTRRRIKGQFYSLEILIDKLCIKLKQCWSLKISWQN